FSGVREFARQWLLINRRTKYKHDGKHELVISVGGSAGHSSLWDVTIDEGKPGIDSQDRKWKVTVEDHGTGKEQKGKKPNVGQAKGKTSRAEDKVIKFLEEKSRSQPGECVPRSEVEKASNLSGGNFTRAVKSLVEEKRVLVEKQTGSNNRGKCLRLTNR